MASSVLAGTEYTCSVADVVALRLTLVVLTLMIPDGLNVAVPPVASEIRYASNRVRNSSSGPSPSGSPFQIARLAFDVSPQTDPRKLSDAADPAWNDASACAASFRLMMAVSTALRKFSLSEAVIVPAVTG